MQKAYVPKIWPPASSGLEKRLFNIDSRKDSKWQFMSGAKFGDEQKTIDFLSRDVSADEQIHFQFSLLIRCSNMYKQLNKRNLSPFEGMPGAVCMDDIL